MQLILLSGGSGKCLWPFSNEARSKQFLPLLENENGIKESMIQRIIRQVSVSGLTKNITIVADIAQLGIIRNQLGEDISVVTEPERRDTFPAIALASSYLFMEKKCSADEIVVVMPCDTYTEIEYFQAIVDMVNCVEKSVADLILMGIVPNYPSAKYGYVVPEDKVMMQDSQDFNVYAVNCFAEKPDASMAEKLLKQGAYWNGGVFAFRLGYIINIINKYVKYSKFTDICAHFTEFPKVSFDHEIVERIESAAVVPFKGKWKDLGTWNTLTDELQSLTIGNAFLGPKCKNTHVVNELQNPIFVDGVSDLVVAACPDGILVCAKKETENIHNFVTSLTTRPMYEERRWGTYRVLDDTHYKDGHHSLTKSITLTEGKNISYQIHHHRTEIWTIVEGEGLFVLNGQEQKVLAGRTVVIPVESWHAIKAITQLTFIEVQFGNPLVEEDIERGNWLWSNI